MKISGKAAAAAAILSLIAPLAASAATLNVQLTPTATVISSCALNSAGLGLGFGNYDPIVANGPSGIDLSASTTILMNCTLGTGVTMSLPPATDLTSPDSAGIAGSQPLHVTFSSPNTAQQPGNGSGVNTFIVNGLITHGANAAVNLAGHKYTDIGSSAVTFTF